MASTIVVSGGVGKLELDGVAGRLIVRPLTIPSSWNTIRIAAYIQLNAPATPALTADFQFGLCSGTTNCYGDVSCTHYVGVGTNGAQLLVASSNHQQATVYPRKRVGVTDTTGTAFTGTVNLTTTWLVPWTRWHFVDITKGSPNYSIRCFVCSTLNSTNYITQPWHYLLCENHSPTHANHAYRAAQTIAVNEGVDGTLNAAMIYLNTTASMWIYDLSVLVMS